ncbi:hypothetical protein NDU88_013115 [Pleurodeles waltl]|uniref:Uncharacterized protein n=1 Tax=Pleurodeles waltl TaxID=8319 RepID=A0AAV7R4Q1_PLEWA|nr:hypothetical protein NDU88_013115 [Pleurodeles waltl]
MSASRRRSNQKAHSRFSITPSSECKPKMLKPGSTQQVQHHAIQRVQAQDAQTKQHTAGLASRQPVSATRRRSNQAAHCRFGITSANECKPKTLNPSSTQQVQHHAIQ